MTPTRESLLSTIRALLEMTEARGCTEAEAALAEAKALDLMVKYGVSLNDLVSNPCHPSQTSATPQAPVTPELWQEPDPDKRRAYEHWSTYGVYSNDADVKGAFSRKAARWNPIHLVARFVAGCGLFALACWAFGTFRVARLENPVHSKDNSAQLSSSTVVSRASASVEKPQ
jgi:hypothetical protein